MTSKIDCVAGSGNVFADVRAPRPEASDRNWSAPAL